MCVPQRRPEAVPPSGSWFPPVPFVVARAVTGTSMMQQNEWAQLSASSRAPRGRGASLGLRDASGQQSWGCGMHRIVAKVPRAYARERPQRRCWPMQTAGQRHRGVTARQCAPTPLRCAPPGRGRHCGGGPIPSFLWQRTHRRVRHRRASQPGCP